MRRAERLSVSTLRLGLIAGAVLFFDAAFALWIQGRAFAYPLHGLISVLLWGAGVTCGVLALVRVVPRRARWLILAGMLALGVQMAYLNQWSETPATTERTDNEMIGRYAVAALKQGINPYSLIYTDLTRVFLNNGTTLTPLLDGSVQNRVTYPALPTLSLWLADAFGISGRMLNLIGYLLLFTLLFSHAPPVTQPLLGVAVLLLKSLLFVTFSGVQDVVWCVLLIVMLLCWQRPLLRALCFGLACSYRQQPWLIAPFLLILLWQTADTPAERLREILVFVGISGGVFALINAPFALNDWQGWWLGVVEPAYAPFNVYSQGFGILSMLNLWTLPREWYTLLQLAVYGSALWLVWRHPRPLQRLLWLVPVVFFWLYYRGLSNYWMYWLPPFALALGLRPFPHLVERQRSGRMTFVPIGGATLMVMISAAFFLQTPPLRASLVAPFRTVYGGLLIEQFKIRVENTSRVLLHPRFAVQIDGGGQALSWTILAGADTLAPGNTADYLISANGIYSRMIPIRKAAQVIVSDGGGQSAVRGVVTLNLGAPPLDYIQNADFRVWLGGADLPQGWTPDLPSNKQAVFALSTVAGREALAINVQTFSDPDRFQKEEKRGEPLRLAQPIPYAVPFTLWLYPEAVADDPGAIYGIELDDGFQCFRLLFVPSTYQTRAQCVTQIIPLPSDQWSTYTVDIPTLYREAKRRPPPFSARSLPGVPPYLAQQVNLRLLAGSALSERRWLFGGIVQTAPPAIHQNPDALIAKPDAYYFALAQEYAATRNYDLALKAWLRAWLEALVHLEHEV